MSLAKQINFVDDNYITNTITIDYHSTGPIKPNSHTIFCLHGNSSTWQTFERLIWAGQQFDVQMVALDLPGCGDSEALPKYSMKLVGQIVRNFIKSFNVWDGYCSVFGHSLGGHLIAFIDDITFHRIFIAGTPPLSSPADFAGRMIKGHLVHPFSPDDEAQKLFAPRTVIDVLSQTEPFTLHIATNFVTHTGVSGHILDNMVRSAMQPKCGPFRSGCLATLASADQIAQLNSMPDNSVIVFHAGNDGVVNLEWLENVIDNRVLFENVVHGGTRHQNDDNYRQLRSSRHMLPHLCADIVFDVIYRALYL